MDEFGYSFEHFKFSYCTLYFISTLFAGESPVIRTSGVVVSVLAFSSNQRL